MCSFVLGPSRESLVFYQSRRRANGPLITAPSERCESLNRRIAQYEQNIDFKTAFWQGIDPKQSKNELHSANLVSAIEVTATDNGIGETTQRMSVDGLLVKDCLREIDNLHRKLKHYLGIEQDLLLAKEKLNVHERQQDHHLWEQYSDLVVSMTRKQNEWRQTELELQIKLQTAETRLTDMVNQMEQNKEQLHHSNIEKQKYQDRALELESDLFKANQKIEQLLQEAEISQLKQRAEIARLHGQGRKVKKRKLRQGKIFQERLLQACECRNRQLEEDLGQSVNYTRKSFESERCNMKARIDELERALQTDAIDHEKKMNLLLLEANHLRWERDKALEEVAVFRMKGSGG
uniref:Uncharacterized protein n=1 Tax=Trichuris muris TaxID=70415 RepID=A0A5S6Q4Z9_TRIMR